MNTEATGYQEVHGAMYCTTHDDFALEGDDDWCHTAWSRGDVMPSDGCELIPVFIPLFIPTEYRIETLMASNDLIANDPLRGDAVLHGVFNSENDLVFVGMSASQCQEWIDS